MDTWKAFMIFIKDISIDFRLKHGHAIALAKAF